jgi:hypothetical protein
VYPHLLATLTTRTTWSVYSQRLTVSAESNTRISVSNNSEQALEYKDIVTAENSINFFIMYILI